MRLVAVSKLNWAQQRIHGRLCKCWLLVIAEPTRFYCCLLGSSLGLGLGLGLSLDLHIRVVVYLQAIAVFSLLLL